MNESEDEKYEWQDHDADGLRSEPITRRTFGSSAREVGSLTSVSNGMLRSRRRLVRPPTKKMHSVPNFTEQEMESALDTFFHEEQTTQKTFSRVVVEKFFSKYKWYFPSKTLKNAPSLSKAWAYYEHVTLPRKVCSGTTAKHIMKRADPGENQVSTELYSFLWTPSSAFIEWGLGVDQYFTTLRLMAVILLVAGLIHLPNLLFYRSSDYSPVEKTGISFSLTGSAVCTTFEWVACSDCLENRFPRPDDQLRYRWAVHPVTGVNTTLVERFACNGGQLPQGLINWSCLIFLVAVLFLVHLYLGAREVRFDEDKITSSDYTVVVQNPPKDAFDPDEWHAFFSQFASKQVTTVTLALNNEDLLRKLIKRRRHRNNLRIMLPKHTNMDDEDALQIAVSQLVHEREQEGRGLLTCILDFTIFPILRIFDICLPPETLLEKSLSLTDEITELLKKDYDVTKVFVTFEDEEGQRSALEALSVGQFDVMFNNTRKMPPSTLFRGQVLTVTPTAEANAIRWLDLSCSIVKMRIIRLINVFLTCGIVGVCGLVVARVRRNNSTFAAILVSVFNTLIPLVVKLLMLFEPHHTEGDFQTSLYLKITLFRWFNTAFLAKLLTSWSNTLGSKPNNILPSINAVLWSELWLTPTLRILDLWGAFQKHYLGPRARTQDQMNSNFQGTGYHLAERYTELTKVLFLCFFYSALYPAAFFFGTAILIIQYYADKFALVRMWANGPIIGSEVARFSRKYFFTGAVLAYCLVSGYAWAGFPYDNLCTSEEPVTGASTTYTNVMLLNGTAANEITVDLDEVFHFCRQNWVGYQGLPFPPTSRVQWPTKHWMSPSQETLTDIFGWTCVVGVVVYFILFFAGNLTLYVLSWIRSVYKPTGQEQHIDFSSDNDINGYVPQIKVGGFLFPFLACDVDDIDKSLIGWTDRGHPYDYHNLIFDVPWDGLHRRKIFSDSVTSLKVKHDTDKTEVRRDRRPVFSMIKHYPPEWLKRLKTQDDSFMPC